MDRSYMSAAAREFLDGLSEDTLPPLSVETVGQHRDAAKADFLPRAERAVTRYGAVVTGYEVGGVPCLEVMPPSVKNEGVILYCYGGGYVSGSAREDLIVSAGLARHAGSRVVAVDYRLAPEHPWPAAPKDAAAVYYELCKEKPPLAIVGESAGGNLALTVMQRARAAGWRMPCAAVLLSPWCDLTHGGDSMAAKNERDPTLTMEHVVTAAKMYAGANDRNNPEISPINADFGPEYPPTLITTGTRDLLLGQSVELARRMRAAGTPVVSHVYDGLWHVFEFYDELPEAAESISEAGNFLAAHFAEA